MFHISNCIRYCEKPRYNSLSIADLQATIRVQVVSNVKFKWQSVQTMSFCSWTSRILQKPKVHQHTQQKSSLPLTLSQLSQHSQILHFNAIYRYLSIYAYVSKLVSNLTFYNNIARAFVLHNPAISQPFI
jgi:hypothetical protein